MDRLKRNQAVQQGSSNGGETNAHERGRHCLNGRVTHKLDLFDDKRQTESFSSQLLEEMENETI
uniref:Uncharacterized protein n=1 Tax=Cucumis melo TaxID=3656 RepID=A0A9I9CTS0_CUCME